MAEEPKSPEPPTPPLAAPGAEAGAPVTPAKAAADKPASTAPGEPLKAEVSRTDAPGAGVSAAPVGEPRQEPPAPKPANPAAAATATTSETSSATGQPTAPAAPTPAPPRAAAPRPCRSAEAGARCRETGRPGGCREAGRCETGGPGAPARGGATVWTDRPAAPRRCRRAGVHHDAAERRAGKRGAGQPLPRGLDRH